MTRCKPAAGSVSVLPNGRIVYWNALMLFVNRKTDKGPVPSVAKQLSLR